MKIMELTEFVSNYHEHGYAVLRGILDFERDLRPIVKEYGGLVDKFATQWLADGTISSYDRDKDVSNRLLQVMCDSGGSVIQHLDISLPLDEESSGVTDMHCGRAVFSLIRNRYLLNAIEMLIGSEIYSSPVQRIRLKPPQQFVKDDHRLNSSVSETAWHQDLAAVQTDADHSDIVTAWIPITEATEENGCVLVVPGSHKDGLAHHYETPTLHGIPDSNVCENRVKLLMAPGDVLFMNKLTMHASLPNRSELLRWSFDLRYLPIGQPTGRPWFPGFIARSRLRPESELSNYRKWAMSWQNTSSDISQSSRWDTI